MAYVYQLLELIYFKIITPWLDHADLEYAYTKEDSHWAVWNFSLGTEPVLL